MDKTQLVFAINDMLRRIPQSIAAASIDNVREFKKWHQQTTKKISTSSLTQLQSIYNEVQNRYR